MPDALAHARHRSTLHADLIGKKWESYTVDDIKEHEVTGVSSNPAYVDVTITSRKTGHTLKSCMPAKYIR